MFQRSALGVVCSFVLGTVALFSGCGGSQGSSPVVIDASAPDGRAGVDCNATTCASGCCDSNGHCQAGDAPTACGVSGNACHDCLSSGFSACDESQRSCYKAVAGCAPANCLGCCQGDLCFSGEASTACGSAGQGCQSCGTDGLTCIDQKCAQPCGAPNCSGCCSGNQCLPGTAPSACGQYGGACADCAALSGTCEAQDSGDPGGNCHIPSPCSSQTCPMGCCDSNGVCQPGTTSEACGSGGLACQPCPANDACNAQQCIALCNAQSCPMGCCDSAIGGTCQTGTANHMCGIGGFFCQDCGALSEVCSRQTCGLPPACQCPDGCCDAAGACLPGTSSTACGSSAGFCEDCTYYGNQCVGQLCIPGLSDAAVCNGDTCPTGCCDEAGNCQQGLADTECGNFGGSCTSCALPAACVNQQCEVPPDAGTLCSQSCRYGCCDTSGSCNVADDTACGHDGEPCVDCTQFGGGCMIDHCVAPDGTTLCSQTCSGCCDAEGNCQIGYSNAQCGEGGGTCVDCTALIPASTCDLDVAPRVCTSQQTQCPATYGGCPAPLQVLSPVARSACSLGELSDAAAACAGGANAPPCMTFFSFEQGNDMACANCLSPFDYDFVAQSGIRACVAPYLSATCNHNSACIADCTTEACQGCQGQAATEQCEAQSQTGACAAFISADQCVSQALSGPAAVCNPTTYQGNFGSWLQAVGEKYCAQ